MSISEVAVLDDAMVGLDATVGLVRSARWPCSTTRWSASMRPSGWCSISEVAVLDDAMVGLNSNQLMAQAARRWQRSEGKCSRTAERPEGFTE